MCKERLSGAHLQVPGNEAMSCLGNNTAFALWSWLASCNHWYHILTTSYPSLTTDLGPQISECHYRTAGSHWFGAVPAVWWQSHCYWIKWFHHQVQCIGMGKGVGWGWMMRVWWSGSDSWRGGWQFRSRSEIVEDVCDSWGSWDVRVEESY